MPEVAGIVKSISPQAREGSFFDKGDLLLALDAINYELDLRSKAANVAEARASLEQELAQAEVVKEDWARLGKKAPALGLRKPQIAAARAMLAAAEAAEARASVDLSRTKLVAPYAGRVLDLEVDIGQYVNVGTTVARIFATEVAEVRLPLSITQLAFVNVPGDESAPFLVPRPKVTLTVSSGTTTYQWEGRIVRAEGAVDEQSRQLYVVAEIDAPFERRDASEPPLRMGQFVTAEIEGKTLEDVFVLPYNALRDGNQVLIVTPENTLERRPVDVTFRDRDNVVIAEGLSSGDVVSLTQPEVVSSETIVQAVIEESVGIARSPTSSTLPLQP